MSPAPRLARSRLTLGRQVLIDAVPSHWRTVADPAKVGVFLQATAPADAACFHEWTLGSLASVRRIAGQYRFVPFWLKPFVGGSAATLRPETLWTLTERKDGKYLLMVALLDGVSRFALRGSTGNIVVTAETGDPATNTSGGLALFVATDSDPYRLFARAARALQQHFQIPHRSARAAPRFLDEFGWCTWDAFYKEVSAEKIATGLASFKEGDVSPKLLIVDDGWQSVERSATGEDRLVSLRPNARFAGDLRPTVRLAKENYGVSTLLVWHALIGYWGGLDEQALARYRPRTVARSFGPAILEQDPTWNVRPWGAVVGVPAAEHVAAFFRDYHQSLAAQGVDGVKVDNQAMLEAVSAGQGGRVSLAQTFRRALESSVAENFSGRLINCMSCSQEALFFARDSVVLRTSDDFYPNRKETHPLHVHANAVAGLWFGEFIQPDWDMFQSGHTTGPLHAAARVLSGGPLYVSDRPGVHDFALLRQLVLADGTHLRCDDPGRPTKDCLFADPTTESRAYKIFNRNGPRGFLGLFNLQSEDGRAAIATYSVADLPTVTGRRFAAYSHQQNALWETSPRQTKRQRLAAGAWDLITYSPIEHGFAAIGVVDKLNPGGTIAVETWDGVRRVKLILKTGGTFLAWSHRRPQRVLLDRAEVAYAYQAGQKRLSFDVADSSSLELVIEW